MLRSMTGYGEAILNSGVFKLNVIARSVNNKNFKMNLTAPENLISISGEIEKTAKKFFSRGTLYVEIEIENDQQPLFSINEKIISSYYRQVAEVRKRLGEDSRINVELLALLPGCINEPDSSAVSNVSSACSCAVIDAVKKAFEALAKSRAKEGGGIEKDIAEKADFILKTLSVIEKRRRSFLKDYSKKLRERVKEIISGAESDISDSDIAREAALLAERSDVSEEMQRLRAHLGELRKVLKSKEPVGRRLEFIVQEMLREANTVASKSIDPKLVVPIIDMKSQIDRIREQSQNVE